MIGEREQNYYLIHANEYLKDQKMVVITGIQGSGKTYLATSIADDLGKTGKKKKIVWISNIKELLEEERKMTRNVDMYIFDGIFYELQSEQAFNETLDALSTFLKPSVTPSIVISIPSFIWDKHKDVFMKAELNKAQIDLDNMMHSVKSSIFHSIMTKHKVSSEKACELCASQQLLHGKTTCKTVGFPALISWICKTSNYGRIESVIQHPLLNIREEIQDFKNSFRIEKKAKYLILSYLALHDDPVNFNALNKKLFEELRRRYCPGFNDSDLKKYVCSMENDHYLFKNEDDTYDFDLRVMKKIVFVSVAEDNPDFVHDHNESYYLRHVTEKEKCPENIKEVYPHCYLVIG